MTASRIADSFMASILVSSAVYRHGLNFPSDVSRSLVHSEQNLQLTGEISPNLPFAPGSVYISAVLSGAKYDGDAPHLFPA